jgi:hypothetical protein
MMQRTRPVSETLVEQLRRTFVSNPVIVWLDKDGHYVDFVDELIADEGKRLGALVLGYRGSYLELMRRIARLGDAVDPAPLLVHVPGANQDSIKRTPLLELNELGFQFRKGLESLIREAAAGRIKPDEVDEFLSRERGVENGLGRERGEVTLAAADAWMGRRLAGADDAAEIMLRGTDPGRLILDLVNKGPIHGQLEVDQLPTVWHYLAAQTGLPDAWPSAERRSPIPDSVPNLAARKRALADIAAAWVLCVEYVHDLKRPPKSRLLQPASELARPLIEACREAAGYLRSHDAKYYVGLADDLEDEIEDERTQGEPDELGRIDTFRFEEDRLLVAALEALQRQDWAQATNWANHRLVGKSVWLDIDPARRRAWELVEHATRLGQALTDSRLSYANALDLDEATRRYAEQGASVDRLQREFEQLVERDLGSSSVPHVELARAAVAALRRCWHAWAERGAIEWSGLCEEHGALPSASMQQRNVYEQVVAPLLGDDERVALFMVDALRFEMATHLQDLIGSPAGTNVRLSARLAELPTVTEVGMNVLAPVVQRGRLQVLLNKQRKVAGFDTGAFKVKGVKDRETLLDRASGGVKWFDLASLVGGDANVNRQIARAKLVVVHSVGIDKAGENGLGLLAFASELRQIHSAWERLRSAGVRRFVFTADHGFLLRNPGDGEPLTHGKFHDALARYALYPDAISNARQLGLSLRNLAYDGADEALILPRGLDVYPLGRDRKFVHGGNSPQERVIPVLVVQHRHVASGEDQRYRVEILDSDSAGGNHLLRARVIRSDNQTTLALDSEPIPLELRAAEGVGVVAEPIEVENATLDAGTIAARVGSEFGVQFRLSSAQEQRVRVELVGAGARWTIDAAISQARFTALAPPVSGPLPTPPPEPKQPPAEAPAHTHGWLDEFDDPGVRRVMQQIAEHGQVNEQDLIALLGNPRKARKFARDFDDYCKRTPFVMEQQHLEVGKVYRKVSKK